MAQHAQSAATPVNWDVLALARFVLAFVVVQFHQVDFFVADPVNSAVAAFGGKAAVVGFLMISGFSIHASLARDPRRFLLRRLRRIYPAYLVALGLCLVLQWKLGVFAAPHGSFEPASPALLACNAALLQMFACKAVAYDGAVWSLSIEFSFYVFALLLAARLGQRALLALAAASLVVFCLPPTLSDGAAYGLLMKFNAAKYLWAFVAGYLAYGRREAAFAFGLGAIAAAAFAISPLRGETLGPLTIAATAGVVWLAGQGGGPRSKLLNYLGDVSYPLYLVHLPIYIGLAGLFGVVDPAILTLVALVGAVLVLEGVEKPVKQILDRVLASPAGAPKAAGA